MSNQRRTTAQSRESNTAQRNNNTYSERNPSRSSTTSSFASSNTQKTSGSSYFAFPVTHTVNGILRRFSADTSDTRSAPRSNPARGKIDSLAASLQSLSSSLHTSAATGYSSAPLGRTISPFQPPPLTPLTLEGWSSSTRESEKVLSRALAEEIRLLLPARLQLVTNWSLAFSVEQNGVSLTTLYQKCEEYDGHRGGFIMVVKDSSGGVFGAFLTDVPRPSPHYFGTGECFLWRASVLASIPELSSLPLPPSADTTNATRMTTLGSTRMDGASTPDRIRFKAFPYSGINDYMMFCETGYISVGGGDGHYGLWLDDSLAKGISQTCPTFGNEPLSDEGPKFEVLGVEMWHIGS